MELNSNQLNMTDLMDSLPAIVVAWSTFGMLLCLLLMSLLMKGLKKIGLRNYFENTYIILSSVMLASFLVGSLTQIILLTNEVSGLHMFFIWIVMFMTYLIFGLLNKKMILKMISTQTPIKEPNPQQIKK